jgi:excisionase family DNA binding protein
MNIQNLIASGENVTVAVSALDLKEFALTILNEAKKNAAPKQEKVFTSSEAAKLLNVSTNTLWRWEKTGYLIPATRVGKSPRYTEAQLTKLMEG